MSEKDSAKIVNMAREQQEDMESYGEKITFIEDGDKKEVRLRTARVTMRRHDENYDSSEQFQCLRRFLCYYFLTWRLCSLDLRLLANASIAEEENGLRRRFRLRFRRRYS